MRLIDQTNDSIKSPLHNKNEDKILIIKADKYSLYFLFDGVGSALHALDAVEISNNFISKYYKNYEQGEKFQLSKLMYDTHLQIINSKIPDAFSTYIAMFVPKQNNSEVSISSMGDSRIYEISKSKQYITACTEDDSIPNRENIITKSLGMPALSETDFGQKDFIPKQSKYLLASDGFYKLMEKNMQRFHEILNFSKLVNIKKSLKKVIVNNNSDDASYILIKINV